MHHRHHAQQRATQRQITQIRLERVEGYPEFALPGDSGALIVSAERLKAIGLFFACPPSGEYGVANPIGEVLDRLDVTLV